VRRRAAGAHSPTIPASVRHASERATFFKPTHQTTAVKCMAHKQKNKNAPIDLDIPVEAHQRFAAIHKALGFKTRTETFEAIVFSITAKDVLHPNVMERIETKLDQTLEIIESLT